MATQRRNTALRRTVMAAVAVAAVAAGCAPDGTGPKLSAVGERGKELAVQRACVGCHGRNGEGGQSQAGPKWVGLYGSTVPLADGTTVVADDSYLYESIRDPAAKQVAGWGAMPQDNLSDGDIMTIIAYIKELAAPAATNP